MLTNILDSNSTPKQSPSRKPQTTEASEHQPLPVLNLPKLKVVLTDCLRELKRSHGRDRSGSPQKRVRIPDGRDGFVHLSDTDSLFTTEEHVESETEAAEESDVEEVVPNKSAKAAEKSDVEKVAPNKSAKAAEESDVEKVVHNKSAKAAEESDWEEVIPNKRIRIQIISTPEKHIRPIQKDDNVSKENVGDGKTSANILKYYKCTECGQKSKRKSDSRTHVMRHLNYEIFRCSVCRFSSSYRKTVQQHIPNCHADDTKASVRIVRNVKLDKQVEQMIKAVYRKQPVVLATGQSPKKKGVSRGDSSKQTPDDKTNMAEVIGYKCVLCGLEVGSRSNMQTHLLKEIG